MIQILQSAAIFFMLSFAFLCFLSAIVFIMSLNRKKIKADKRLISVFIFNYWSKVNVVNNCKPNWVPYVLTFRYLVLISLYAIFLLVLVSWVGRIK